MKRLKLLAFAFSPFLINYCFHLAVQNNEWIGKGLTLSSFFFAAYWLFVGYKSATYTRTAKESVLIGNIFALVSVSMLLLRLDTWLMTQGIVYLGSGPQFFFFPMLRVTQFVERTFLFFLNRHVPFFTFILSCILMIVIYYLGYRLRKKLS
ncbi:MAG: hypothetical protein FH749_16015 [Firmicutes bacterium]|nr:hypothetical protein [Bacillota bacterium]